MPRPLKYKIKRICLYCKIEFGTHSRNGKFCSTECKHKRKLITDINLHTTHWYVYFKRLVRFAGREALTIEDCLQLLNKQDGRCALSGVDLTHIRGHGIVPTNASIDRVDAGGPYIKENVQLVCCATNAFRGSKSIAEYLWWCKKVCEYNYQGK